jgi:hypothetical protein
VFTCAGDRLVITGNGGSSVTAADADLAGSALAAALTVTTFGAGIISGVVYFPAASIVPESVFPPSTPFTDQVTAWFVEFVTFALNVLVVPKRSVTDAGETVTLTGPVGVVAADTAGNVNNNTNGFSKVPLDTIGFFLPYEGRITLSTEFAVYTGEFGLSIRELPYCRT